MSSTNAPAPISALEHALGLQTTDAEDLLQLTFAVDQHIAIQRYGYPKDNLIPPPMHERLADPEYLRLLLTEAEDADSGEFSDEIVHAIRARFENALGGDIRG